jgi:primosomal protein DnaI
MKNIVELAKEKRNIKVNTKSLKQEFMKSLEDQNFVKIVNRLDVPEEVLINNNSKIRETIEELKNCKTCKGLDHCKNHLCGYVSYPVKEGEGLIFDYVPCKYQKEINREKTNVTYFEVPKFIKEAKMSDIYPEKERLSIIKYMKDFISKFDTDKKLKGLYLCGSFGSGKSYLISALINEVSKKGYNSIILYYPNLLSSLKASFNTEDFDIKLDSIMRCDLLLIDDIGAENNTAWSRDEILGTILQKRMNNYKTTFFTSNLNMEELERHLRISSYSDDEIKARRIIERIKQLTNYMELISENKRK